MSSRRRRRPSQEEEEEEEEGGVGVGVGVGKGSDDGFHGNNGYGNGYGDGDRRDGNGNRNLNGNGMTNVGGGDEKTRRLEKLREERLHMRHILSVLRHRLETSSTVREMMGGRNNHHNDDDDDEDGNNLFSTRQDQRQNSSSYQQNQRHRHQQESKGRTIHDEIDMLNRERDYRYELEVLRGLSNTGVREGMIACLTTFAFLRFGPSILARYIQRSTTTTTTNTSGFHRPGTYKLDPNPFARAQQQQRQQQQLRETPFPSSTVPPAPSVSSVNSTNSSSSSSSSSVSSIFLRGTKLGLDIFVSLLVGAYTSLVYTNERKVMETISTIPLLPGRSFISDEFCPIILSEIRHVPPSSSSSSSSSSSPHQYWSHVESPFLRHIHQFGVNCRKRNAYESKLRAERSQHVPDQYDDDEDHTLFEEGDYQNNSGSSSTDHDEDGPLPRIFIPEPGVPTDYDFREFQDDDEAHDDDDDDEFYDDSNNAMPSPRGDGGGGYFY